MDNLTSEELKDCYQKQAKTLREWSLLMLHDWKSIPSELENFPVEFGDDARDSVNENAEIMHYYFSIHGDDKLKKEYNNKVDDFIKDTALCYFLETDQDERDDFPLENRQSFFVCAMEFMFLSFLFENYHLIKQEFGIDGPLLFNTLNYIKDDVTYESGRLVQYWISKGAKLRFDLERTRKSTKGHLTAKAKRKKMALRYYYQIKREDLSLWDKARKIRTKWVRDIADPKKKKKVPTQRTIFNYLKEEGKN